MARISTYPIISTPAVDDLLIGTDVNDLNITKNFTIGEIGELIGQDYVPYVGATGNVNLGSFNITASSFIVPGGLASQFVKADGSLDSTAYTPQTRTLTINGTTYNLSANRSWDLNTLDSLTTIGTSGAATYIGKVLNIPVYQAQGSYITQLSGEATAVGPGNATVTLSNSAVISKVLTGLNVTGGTVVSTDTILQAFGKVQNQINGLAGGVEYQGTWNAATNNPFLQSSVGVQGHYYVVNVAGNTNLNGITDWQVGDWAIYNGSAWEKVDNTDAVVSVNGYVGAVVLTSSDVGAVPTTRTLTINGVGYNLSADRSWTVGDVRTDQSYTNPSWIASLAWSKITGTPTTLAGYGITDGALNTRTLTINGTTYDLTANRTWNVGTVTSVGTSGPLTGGTITGSGTIGITQAGASSDGYLSSADWNAFNSKQEVISVTAPITFAAGVIGITQSGVSSNGYLSSTDWTTFNSKVSGSGTANTLPMWGTASSLINSPLSYAADTFNFQYNSATGGTVNFTNIGLTAYTYSIQMNNFGSPRSTVHSYTDGIVVQSIGGTQVSRVFANGNTILGSGVVDNGYKLEVSGNLYVNSIINATTDTDRFIVSDGGVIKYRTGAEVLSDIGAVPTTRQLTINGTAYDLSADRSWSVGTVTSVGLSMPPAFTVSNSPVTSVGTLTVVGAGNATQYVRGDGALATLPTSGTGGGASVSYYLNGSVNQGTIGGVTYYEMNRTPIIGTGTDFTRNTNGYIASFLTDAGDPALLAIPAGNWNFETYFNASSGGGSPTFYIELYKYDGTTFTLIASNSGSPKLINDGTSIEAYFSALAVPQTTLTLTDRLAIRIYVTTSGRTITLHTENSHLCQVITTFTTGLTALNGLTAQVQYFATGTSGADFNILSAVDTHTFNLPTASAVNRGALSSADWTTFNNKQATISLTTTGTSGASTLVGNTLNIPNYTDAFVGTVTSVSFSLGSTGTDLSSSVANSTTTPAITLNVPTASATNRGVLSSANWSTFNSKQDAITLTTTGTSGAATLVGSTLNIPQYQAAGTYVTAVTASSPLASSGGTTPNITIQQASGSQNGFLSSTDWTTFNNKQNALTNPVTGTGTTNYLAKFTGSTTVGNSQVFDNGTNVGIGTATPNDKFHVVGGIYSTSLTTPTNTNIGAIQIGYDGTNGVIRTWNSSPLIISTYNYQAFETTGSERARITSGGNVQLTGDPFVYSNTTSGGTAIHAGLRFNSTNKSIRFFTNDVTAVDILSNGNVLIGTTTDAGARIQVSGNATINGDLGLGVTTPLSGGGAAKWLTLEGNSTYSGGTIYSVSSSAKFYHYLDNDGLFAHQGQSSVGQKFITNGTERMRITSGGNVGIGTTSPSQKLEVNNGASSSYVLVVGQSRNLYLGQDSIGAAIYSDGSAPMYFATNATERMRITSGGNLLVGTTTDAGYKLFVNGYTKSTGYSFNAYSGGGEWQIGSDAATGSGLYFYQTTFGYSLILSSGGAATFSSTLDTGGRITITADAGNEQFNIRRASNTNQQLILGYHSDGYGKIQAIEQNVAYRPLVLNQSGGNVGIGTTAPGTSPNNTLLGFALGSNIQARTAVPQLAFSSNIDGDWFSPTYKVSNFATQIYLDSNQGTMGFRTASSGTAGNAITWNTPAIFIANAGNVGIGTTSPTEILHLNKTSGTGTFIRFQDTAGGGTYIGGRSENMELYAGNTERMRITSAGNIGIGTSSPDSKLSVFGTFRNFLSSGGGGDTLISAISGVSNGYLINVDTSNNITHTWHTGANAASMRITSGGNVLIGTTTDAGYTLNLVGNAQFIKSSTSTAMVVGLSGVTGSIIRFSYNGGFVGSISTDGSNTAYNTSSDYRLKQDIKDFNGLDLLSKIKTYDFEWKSDKTRSYGVLAHELQEVINYAVHGDKDAEEMQEVDYSKLVPILIKAIQELNEKIK